MKLYEIVVQNSQNLNPRKPQKTVGFARQDPDFQPILCDWVADQPGFTIGLSPKLLVYNGKSMNIA
jgi:hypothetical protein